MAEEVAPEDIPTRWEVELEFVQSLANTQYLTYLAQTGKLEDPNFLNYLEYLEYWREPEYAKQLVYPDCLHVLTLLKSPEFRKQITKSEVGSVIYNDMVERWKAPLKEAKEPPQPAGQQPATEKQEGPQPEGAQPEGAQPEEPKQEEPKQEEQETSAAAAPAEPKA